MKWKLTIFFIIATAIVACMENDLALDVGETKGNTTGIQNEDFGTAVKCGDGKARDIVFVLDSTTSVSDANWNIFIRIAELLASKLDVGTGEKQTRYSMFEFGATTGVSLDAAISSKKINFLVGSSTQLATSVTAFAGMSAAQRKVREGYQDALGPAMIRAYEYLQRVGRPGASKEIWAIHDMKCCGFPETGEKGTQIQDATWVKNQGVTIVGIRTLASMPIGDQIPSAGLAFDLGTDIQALSDNIITEVAVNANKVICN